MELKYEVEVLYLPYYILRLHTSTTQEEPTLKLSLDWKKYLGTDVVSLREDWAKENLVILIN